MSTDAGRAALLIYAILLAVGGAIGFVKAGSRPSLIAGLASGAVALLSLGLTYYGRGQMGFWLGIELATVMAIVFVIRFRKTGKFMPSGLLAGLSLAMLGAMGTILAQSLR